MEAITDAPIVIVDSASIDDDHATSHWKSLDACLQLPYVAMLVARILDGELNDEMTKLLPAVVKIQKAFRTRSVPEPPL